MAEENPLIEIKIPPKKIEDTREQYLFENEKLIIGPSGFVFRSYPTLKERLQQYSKQQEEYNKLLKIKLRRNNSLSVLHQRKNEKIFLQPILRFKNRTDFERICDTIQQYVLPNEQESLKELRERHVKGIDFPTGLLYKGGFKEMKKLESLTRNNKKNKNNINLIKTMFSLGKLTNMNNVNNNFNTTKNNLSPNFDINKDLVNLSGNKKPKIYFTRLQRLNAEAKKIRSNLHYKTHFKGVESVFINPKSMNDILRKDENLYVNKKMGNYSYNQDMEKVNIEKKNEYKEDIKNLIREEKEKENIINTKFFSNFLNNKNYYNDRAIVNKYEKNIENKDEKIKKINDLNYLKNLAFENNSQKLLNGERIGTDSSEDKSKNRKKINYDNESQLRIGGKIYHMNNQMELIAKEILNKCKYYSKKK